MRHYTYEIYLSSKYVYIAFTASNKTPKNIHRVTSGICVTPFQNSQLYRYYIKTQTQSCTYVCVIRNAYRLYMCTSILCILRGTRICIYTPGRDRRLWIPLHTFTKVSIKRSYIIKRFTTGTAQPLL